jgi:hypothetical protein
VGKRDAGGYVAGAAPGAVRGARVQKEPGATCAPAFYGSASAHRTAGLRVAVFVAEPAPVLQARNSAVGQEWDGSRRNQRLDGDSFTTERCGKCYQPPSQLCSLCRPAPVLGPRSLCILFYVSDRQGSFTTIVPWRNLPAPFQPVPCPTLCVFLVCIHTLLLTALRTTHVGCPHWLTAF